MSALSSCNWLKPSHNRRDSDSGKVFILASIADIPAIGCDGIGIGALLEKARTVERSTVGHRRIIEIDCLWSGDGAGFLIHRPAPAMPLAVAIRVGNDRLVNRPGRTFGRDRKNAHFEADEMIHVPAGEPLLHDASRLPCLRIAAAATTMAEMFSLRSISMTCLWAAYIGLGTSTSPAYAAAHAQIIDTASFRFRVTSFVKNERNHRSSMLKVESHWKFLAIQNG